MHRQYNSNGTLLEERINILDSIGFKWQVWAVAMPTEA